MAVRRAMVTYTARRLGFADEEGRETKWREAGALAAMLNERKELRWGGGGGDYWEGRREREKKED